MSNGLITDARVKFYTQLMEKGVLSWSPLSQSSANKFGVSNVPSNADSSQRLSVRVAHSMLKKLEKLTGANAATGKSKLAGQTLGNVFEDLCAQYIENSFKTLSHLRPGTWSVRQVKSRSANAIGDFEQYQHLSELTRLAKENDELRSFLGEGYTVAPDVVVTRMPEPDEVINSQAIVVDEITSKAASLRASIYSGELPEILHASISCKFTMRSDRSQNTRTEALNLLRSRKGRAPHIISITAEPTPSRLASLALGTGDLDCVYHFALYELKETLEELELDDALDLLSTMISGKRLKDISDLPLDLSI